MKTLKVYVKSMFKSKYIPAVSVNVSIMIDGFWGSTEQRFTDDNGFAEFPVNDSCTVDIYVNNLLYKKAGVHHNDEAVSIIL